MKKNHLRALLNKAKKVIAIFAAMGYDKHLDYDKDESKNREKGKEKKSERRLFR